MIRIATRRGLIWSAISVICVHPVHLWPNSNFFLLPFNVSVVSSVDNIEVKGSDTFGMQMVTGPAINFCHR